MKTLTITLHDTDNCGSSLQAFALQHFLLKNHIENEIIDYVPSYTQNNGNPLRTFIRKIVFFWPSYIRKKKFKQFIREHVKITKKKYTNYKELEQEDFDADVFITGSDQLWNSMYGCGNDPAFYLKFVKNGKKISYAMSLGRAIIPNDNLSIVKKYVKNYSWISLREKSYMKQLQEIFPKTPMSYVCDPVLLNDIEDYGVISSPRLIKEKYILVYLAQKQDKKQLNDLIKKVKNIFNVKVVFIGSYLNKCECDIHKRDTVPGDFLSLISNAEYVISNSFHATVFSLMYNKQFVSILPTENGERIKEILELVGADGNIWRNQEKLIVIDKDVYQTINDRIYNFRTQSGRILLELLQ